MDDFSKIDVWALGILLINMLTLDFPFFWANDIDDYEKFVSNPEEFFIKHQVQFNDVDELNSICNLLK